jgi:hypothetical protein
MTKFLNKIIIIITIILLNSSCIYRKEYDIKPYSFKLKNKTGENIKRVIVNSNVDVYYYEYNNEIKSNKTVSLPLTLHKDSVYNVQVFDDNFNIYYKENIRIKSGFTITFTQNDINTNLFPSLTEKGSHPHCGQTSF